MEMDNTLKNNELPVIKIPASFDTPEVTLDKESGVFKLEGNSYPEDPVAFYKPVHDWFAKYALNPNEETVLVLHFKYFSTSSTQILFEIFRIMENLKCEGKNVSIKWLYDSENEEIKENGENYSTLFYVPFELVEIRDE
jgi:hypothetical protein